MDGQSLGVVDDSPESASWTWQAWPMGIHTFSARATTADGKIGQSQTVIVNVLQGNSPMQVPAGEGQTLEQIGADFGVPPDQMAGANPKVDPSQPLPGGQPVQFRPRAWEQAMGLRQEAGRSSLKAVGVPAARPSQFSSTGTPTHRAGGQILLLYNFR